MKLSWSFFVLLLLLAVPQSALSGVVAHQWSRAFVGLYLPNYVYDVALDADGGMVLIGGISCNGPPSYGVINYGGYDLICITLRDNVMARFDSDGNHVWSKIQGEGVTIGQNVEVDNTGHIIMTGTYDTVVPVFGGSVTGTGPSFLVRFSSSGYGVWTIFSMVLWREVEIDQSNNIYVVGDFWDSVDLGAGILTSAGSSDILVAKIAPDGTVLWSRRYGGAGTDTGGDIALDGSDNIILTGRYDDTIYLGTDSLATVCAGSNLFLAQLDHNGDHLWSNGFCHSSSSYGSKAHISVDVSDAILISGGFSGTIDFGGETLTSSGGDDVYVAKFDNNGGHIWSDAWGDGDNDNLIEFGTYSDGKILLVALFGTNVGPAGDPDSCSGYTYAAGLDTNGEHIWSKRVCSGPGVDMKAADVNDSGDFTIAGLLKNTTIDLGGGPLVGGSKYQFAAKFLMDEASGLEESPPSYGLEITSYPNPFNPATTIGFVLPAATNAELAIYNALGERVVVLSRGILEAGPHSVKWDGRDGSGGVVGSGVYFCRLETPGSVTTRKLVLTK